MNDQNRKMDQAKDSKPAENLPYSRPELTKYGKVDTMTQQQVPTNPISPGLTS